MAIVSPAPLSVDEFLDLYEVAAHRGKTHLLFAPLLGLRTAQGLPGSALTMLALEGEDPNDDSADIASDLYESLTPANRIVFRRLLDRDILQSLSRDDSTDPPELTPLGLRESLIADLCEIRANWLPQAQRKGFDVNKAIALGDDLVINLEDNWTFEYGGRNLWSFVQNHGREQLAYRYIRGVKSFEVITETGDGQEVFGWPDEASILI